MSLADIFMGFKLVRRTTESRLQRGSELFPKPRPAHPIYYITPMRGALSLCDICDRYMGPAQVHQLREPLHFSRKLDGPGGEFATFTSGACALLSR